MVVDGNRLSLYFFTAINQAAYLFGAFFIIQNILFLIFGVFQKRLSFHFRSDKYGITGMSLIIFALIIYPLLGYFSVIFILHHQPLVCLVQPRFLLSGCCC